MHRKFDNFSKKNFRLLFIIIIISAFKLISGERVSNWLYPRYPDVESQIKLQFLLKCLCTLHSMLIIKMLFHKRAYYCNNNKLESSAIFRFEFNFIVCLFPTPHCVFRTTLIEIPNKSDVRENTYFYIFTFASAVKPIL